MAVGLFGVGLRIDGLLQLAFLDDRIFGRSNLLTTFDFELFLFALVDLRDADDMLILGNLEDGYAHRVAARNADIPDRGADDLALVRDQHQLLALARREAGNYAAVALGRIDVGDA